MSQNSFWKKAGWFIATAYTRRYSGLTQGQLMELVQETYMANVSWIIVFYQLIGIFVFGLWYYLAYGRKKRPAGAEKPGIKELAMIVALGGFLQVFISGMLGIISEIFPDLMKEYAEIMKAAGITDMTVVVFIATVIFAPIGEELLCRGIIFRLAGKVSPKFWVANCIQALAFGIIHANLVQGTYAFFLGAVLGYIYGKYRNIWVCMLLHGAINFSSNYVTYLWDMVPEQNVMLGVSLICTLALVFIILIMKLLGKIKPLEVNQGNMVSE